MTESCAQAADTMSMTWLSVIVPITHHNGPRKRMAKCFVTTCGDAGEMPRLGSNRNEQIIWDPRRFTIH